MGGEVLPDSYLKLFDSKRKINIKNERTNSSRFVYKAVYNIPKGYLESVKNFGSAILSEDDDDILDFSYDDEEDDEYEIEIGNIVSLPNGKIIERIEFTNDNSNNVIKLSSNEVSLPLYVRNRRNGDKIAVKGLNGHKKVSDIFIDEKIKVNDRKSWPVVLDSEDNIVWLPGLKKSKLDKKNSEEYDIILKYH